MRNNERTEGRGEGGGELVVMKGFRSKREKRNPKNLRR